MGPIEIETKTPLPGNVKNAKHQLYSLLFICGSIMLYFAPTEVYLLRVNSTIINNNKNKN